MSDFKNESKKPHELNENASKDEMWIEPYEKQARSDVSVAIENLVNNPERIREILENSKKSSDFLEMYHALSSWFKARYVPLTDTQKESKRILEELGKQYRKSKEEVDKLGDLPRHISDAELRSIGINPDRMPKPNNTKDEVLINLPDDHKKKDTPLKKRERILNALKRQSENLEKALEKFIQKGKDIGE